jgi:hypothetical protein
MAIVILVTWISVTLCLGRTSPLSFLLHDSIRYAFDRLGLLRFL